MRQVLKSGDSNMHGPCGAYANGYPVPERNVWNTGTGHIQQKDLLSGLWLSCVLPIDSVAEMALLQINNDLIWFEVICILRI